MFYHNYILFSGDIVQDNLRGYWYPNLVVLEARIIEERQEKKCDETAV